MPSHAKANARRASASRRIKRPRHEEQSYETADEFLAAAVDFEEAGEKWRAGDAAKALRFFDRAIQTYDRGLQRWQGSFDLAYNKARLKFSITQYPRLLALSSPSLPLASRLRTALTSHRHALPLDPSNPDVIFNTAQVLSSLAEAIEEGTDGRDDSDDSREKERQEAVHLYEEALELFLRCLELQERMYGEQEARRREIQRSMDAGASTTDTEPSSSAPSPSPSPLTPTTYSDHYVSVEDPITPSTLLDTLHATLETLTALCPFSLCPPSTSSTSSTPPLPPLQTLHLHLTPKIHSYLTLLPSPSPSHHHHHHHHNHHTSSLRLASANFAAATASSTFKRAASPNAAAYEARLADAFTPLTVHPQSAVAPLCDHAEALMAFNAAMAEMARSVCGSGGGGGGGGGSAEALGKRWTALTLALRLLQRAAQKQTDTGTQMVTQHAVLGLGLGFGTAEMARLHMRRGDVEMARLEVAREEEAGMGAGAEVEVGKARTRQRWDEGVRAVVRGNAMTYYRGAAGLAARDGDGEVERESKIKMFVAAAVAGIGRAGEGGEGEVQGVRLEGAQDVLRDGEAVKRVVRDMLEEGLIGEDVARTTASVMR